MRSVFALAAICALAGCVSPPKPAECRGEFRPVNAATKAAALDPAQSVALCTKGSGHDSKG